MLIQLPVETWIEILDWLQRRDLLKKLDKLWDREFTPIVQDWLHKYTRNVKIGKLWTDTDGLSVCLCKRSWAWEKVPFADVELPQNVTSFDRINISYLDSTVLAFLQRMRPIFHNIHLGINCGNESLQQTALHRLMPTISSIESLACFDCIFQFFFTNYPAALFNAKFLQLWSWQLSDESKQVSIDWLFTKRNDGQARILTFDLIKELPGLCEKIRERFLDPTRQCACPFFVRIGIFLQEYQLLANIPNSENVLTGEQLTFRMVHCTSHYLLITNYCQTNNTTNVELLNKRTEEALKWSIGNEQQVIMLQAMESTCEYFKRRWAEQQLASGSQEEAT